MGGTRAGKTYLTKRRHPRRHHKLMETGRSNSGAWHHVSASAGDQSAAAGRNRTSLTLLICICKNSHKTSSLTPCLRRYLWPRAEARSQIVKTGLLFQRTRPPAHCRTPRSASRHSGGGLCSYSPSTFVPGSSEASLISHLGRRLPASDGAPCREGLPVQGLGVSAILQRVCCPPYPNCKVTAS